MKVSASRWRSVASRPEDVDSLAPERQVLSPSGCLREALGFLNTIPSGAAGDELLWLMAAGLDRVLSARAVLIALRVDARAEKPLRHALLVDRQCSDWVEGYLAGPMAKLAAGSRGRCYRAGVCRRFPLDPLLARVAAESLFILPIRDGRGRSLGLIGVVDDRPVADARIREAVITLFGQRIAEARRDQWPLRVAGPQPVSPPSTQQHPGAVPAAVAAVPRARGGRPAVEAALQESEERLGLALDAGAMAIWDWDLQTNEIHASPRHAALFRDERDGGRGGYRALSRHIHPEDRRAFEQALWDAREKGNLLHHEFRVIWPDGDVRWLNVRGRYLYGGDGHAVRLMALTADITERKRAEEALRESESRFRGMFEAMTEAVAFHELVYDENGMVVDYRILNVNPAFERYTGIPVAQAIGKKASVLYGTGAPPFLETYRRVATGGIPTSFATFFAPLGRYFDISVFSPGWGRFVTLFEDTTERHRLQEREKRRQEELIRTAGIITMGEMASSIAHELNQPLTSIATYSEGCLDRLRTGELDLAQLPEIFGEISQEALRAAGVLRSVRKFIQKREFSIAPVALNRLIDRVAHFTETQQHAAGGQLHLQLQPDLPQAMADEILIEIVLLNLIRNGLDAMDGMPDSERDLTITTTIDDAGKIVAAVSDRGTGVSAEALDEIFGAYVTSKAEGMGLGLAISRSIVESHGGRLTATNNPNGGATFSFSLNPGHQGVSQ